MLKRMSFASMPLNLVFHLKRFDAFTNKKIDEHVAFPIYDLTLLCDNGFVSSPLSNSLHTNSTEVTAAFYDLHGVIAHYGTLDHGHYISYVKIKNQDVIFVRQSLRFPAILSKYADFFNDQVNCECAEDLLDSFSIKSLLKEAFTSMSSKVSILEDMDLSNTEKIVRSDFRWLKYDDDSTSLVGEDEVRNAPAYMLFYRKVER